MEEDYNMGVSEMYKEYEREFVDGCARLEKMHGK
jgi:hypothetical protein